MIGDIIILILVIGGFGVWVFAWLYTLDRRQDIIEGTPRSIPAPQLSAKKDDSQDARWQRGYEETKRGKS